MSNAPAPPDSIRRVVVASFIGTAIEWYDFFLYGTAAALVFNRLFFPNFAPLVGTMAAFATYAVGFFARPLGGIVFGHFGDRVGRKSMLVTTLVMMGLATFFIGVLPTYEQAGVVAPLLLVLLRFVQGLGVGGEWGGAVLMVVEHANKGRRGLYASWVQAGVPVGMLLATGIFQAFASLPEREFLAWGWRVPFLLGIVLTGIGFFIRLKIMESPIFEQAKSLRPAPKLPLLEVIRTHPKNILLAMGARVAENGCFYIFTVWVLSYATQQLGMARTTLLNGVLLGSAVQLVAIPLFGRWSDSVGRKPVYLGGAAFLLLMAFPFFWLVETRSIALVWLAIVAGMIGHAAMYGPQAAFFSELFGTRTRYTGASLGYQLAAPFAGGLAPLIASALLGWSGGRPWPIAVYLIGMAAVTIGCVLLTEETNRNDLGHHDGAK
ncbi:MAG: MHS family MFS transporter [Verrucomicrobia bacterium]|nr:MHS family MFS transporter [Verrucomicrobiota bacterium]